jgi:glycine cleavage system H protein
MNVPGELRYSKDHEWARLEDGKVRVGITDYAQDALGDVVFVELPAVGSTVTAATVVGEIESTKSVGELYAPLTGEVIEVNDAVVDDPSLVNADPFGAGWLVKLTVDPAAVAELLDRDAYISLTGGAE